MGKETDRGLDRTRARCLGAWRNLGTEWYSLGGSGNYKGRNNNKKLEYCDRIY